MFIEVMHRPDLLSNGFLEPLFTLLALVQSDLFLFIISLCRKRLIFILAGKAARAGIAFSQEHQHGQQKDRPAKKD